MKIELNKRTARQIIALDRALTKESRQTLREVPKPDTVCGVAVPRDLNDLTIGELFSLKVDEQDALIEQIAAVVLKIEPGRLYDERADKVFGLLFWIGREIDRIAQLFDSISSKPTPDEIRAGVLNLDFGAFGIIDWYALRQGYKDHDEVMDVPWVRIRECMRIDNERAQYERRLQEIRLNKNKQR